MDKIRLSKSSDAYTYENPYKDEGCEQCEEHGSPCIGCADDAKGVDGPGHLNGSRLLLPGQSDPNIFRTMLYWVNQHPTETVGIRLVPFSQPKVPVFDINVCSLGLLGRQYTGVLREDTNVSTVFVKSQETNFGS